MRSTRTTAVFVAMMLASAVVAPAAAGFYEAQNSGNTGVYTVPDYNGQAGVVCRYEDNPGTTNDEIDRIAVKKMWTHGPYAQKTWVGQRILIKKNARPFSDGKFQTVWRSPIIKGKANQSEVAFFPVRGWKAPEKSKAQYRVQVLFFYYKPGSKTKVVGRVRGLEEVYRYKMPLSGSWDFGEEGDAGWCGPRFPVTI